jgi:hypothetical protein
MHIIFIYTLVYVNLRIYGYTVSYEYIRMGIFVGLERDETFGFINVQEIKF